MQEFDELVLQCFLENQHQLFPEPVAHSPEEAEAFLEECMAIVVHSPTEVWEYFDEQGIDLEGERLSAEEIFALGDGRYLIVEG